MVATFTTPKRPLTWLITGCSSGFGLSLARLVQANGHNLIATSRNPARTPELVAEVEKAGGKWLALDVDDKNSGKVIEDLEKGGRAVDVLVNNAGYSVYGPAEILTEEEIRAQTETVYFGPYRLIRAALPHMRQRKFGVIVNMSSGAALEGRDSMSVYAAAKAALDGKQLKPPSPGWPSDRLHAPAPARQPGERKAAICAQ
jgi:short-subunit dehydrogenase